MEFTKANIWEIKKSGSLKTLGGLIALLHTLQFYFWSTEGHLPLKLVQQGLPMCWSVFDGCGWVRIIPFGLLSTMYYAYPIVMALAALVMLITDWVAVGFYLLLTGVFFSSVLYFQDMRLSSNEGYFVLFASFAYLFVPSKHRLMRWLIASFIAARGLSQGSADWLTGGWYMHKMSVPVKLGEWLAAMSLLVQMIGAATLVFRDGRYFWTGWIFLFIYQCGELYIGDAFPAMLAMGALLYVALDELELRKAEREYLYQSFIRPEPSILWGAILLTFFWLAQVHPFLPLARESKVRTFLSSWALHPEAAQDECDQTTLALYKNRTEEIDVEAQVSTQPAMACNAYLRFLDVKAACKDLKAKDSDFVTLSSVLQVRNFREKSAYRAFEVKDFCNEELTFKRLNEVKWTTNPGT